MTILKPLGIVLACVLIAACGRSSDTSTASNTTAPGTLAEDPPFRIASLDAAALGAALGTSTSGAELLAITGVPACGVDFYYIKFWTVGALPTETTESSGALMVPTGGAGCTGPRPVVLYAHGTNTNKALNIADITDSTNTEGALIAAMFAAQGYIVVAPNYAGYDISTLGYHPFLNAAQQSGEMMNILTAARTAPAAHAEREYQRQQPIVRDRVLRRGPCRARDAARTAGSAGHRHGCGAHVGSVCLGGIR